jgi:integration host factor subunit alpha
MAITKSDMTRNLYEKLGLSKRECGDIADKFLKIIKKALADGEDVRISGFGNFMIKHKRTRRGRNPKTGEEVEIAERKILVFRLSEVLRDEINDGRD